MGRLIGTTTQYTFLPGHNFQDSYGHDAASNRTSLTAPDGSYNYDALNRLTSPSLLQSRRSRALRIEIEPDPVIRLGRWWKHGLLAQPEIIYLVAQA